MCQWDTWDSIGLSHLSYMGQWDRTDTWDRLCQWDTWNSIGLSHLSYMGQWDRTDGNGVLKATSDITGKITIGHMPFFIPLS